MGIQLLYARVPHLLSLPVSFSSAGDNIVVTGIANKRIHVHRIWIVFGSAETVIFKNGTVALSGSIPVAANGAFTFDITGEPWFSMGIGNNFIINLASGSGVNGMIYYKIENQ